jgi:myo-inositol-1(or 4)-monophosphatase
VRRHPAEWIGSTGPAWVAAGRFDAFWERDLKAWDIAAGIVMVREAGGFAGSLDNTGDVLETGNIVAGNEHILAELKVRLAKAA